MKVTMKSIKYLSYNYHFNVISVEKTSKTVTNPIPYETGWELGYFPNYLRGYESYYEENRRYGHRLWKLKDEYEENRPTYNWNVAYTVYDIELTNKGKEEVERRYYMHLRNMEKYLRLMD